MTIEVLILLLAFQVKHFLADYPFQHRYMYENKGKPTGWIVPLADHATVHALITIIIVILYLLSKTPGILAGSALYYIAITALFDFVTHFVIDRWKATRKGGPDTSGFWINLGIDQGLHHTVGILIIYFITQGV